MNSAAIESLQTLARIRLATIGSLSGRILYSAARTLTPGALYILGLNPGGDPSLHVDTVGDGIDELGCRVANAYLDESWKGRPAGHAPIQRRVQWLVGKLGIPLADVCSSNLIFIRSRSATLCGYPHMADLCWPIHRAILDIVQPRLILTFGNSSVSPFQYLREQFHAREIESIASGHGDWRCLAFRVTDGPTVVGIPHLSRYAVDRHPAVGGWIRALANL